MSKLFRLKTSIKSFRLENKTLLRIRNCIKYIYDNASAPTDKRIKYVNLFGDASFDYKNRIPNNTNIVPIFHALNSSTIGESFYASDDFFGLMDAKRRKYW